MSNDDQKRNKRAAIMKASLPSEEQLTIAHERWFNVHKKNCLSQWLPILSPVAITPKTNMIVFGSKDLYPITDGKECEAFDKLVQFVKDCASELGYPCFLRSGQTSAKHYWKDTCFLAREEDIIHHLHEIIQFSMFVDIPFNTWVVREFIELESTFTAFHGELPINKEQRWFFEDGKIKCHHPYWPEFSIKNPNVVEWKEKLIELNTLNQVEEVCLSVKTQEVANAFKEIGGAWSIDWAKSKSGLWYAIDMAIAESSYHWPECEDNQPVHAQ